MVFSIYEFNAKVFAQGWAGEQAAASIEDPERFSDRTQAALSKRTWLTNDIAGTLADVLTQNATARDPAYSQAAGQVAAQLENEIAASNLDPRAYIRLGALYNVMGAGDRSALPKAEAVLHTAIQLTPDWPEYYDALAQTYLLEGRNDEALALLKKAVGINPENGVALWMYAFPLIWNHHEQEGRAVLEAATQRYNYENREDLKRLVNTYYQLKDFPKAIQFEKELVQLEPADAAHRYTLATLYKASGNTVEALEAVKIAAQLDPRYNAAIRQFQ
jgi:tetratricopeptide (TPR) repeat protein